MDTSKVPAPKSTTASYSVFPSAFFGSYWLYWSAAAVGSAKSRIGLSPASSTALDVSSFYLCV